MSRTSIAAAALVIAVAVGGGAAATAQPAAVVLSDETVFRVDGERGTMTRRVMVQINRASARHHGQHVIYHDRNLRRIRWHEGRILGMNGQELRILRRSDIRDAPASDGFSLYDDHRVRISTLYHDQFPHIVEWSWEETYNSLLVWNAWYPQIARDSVAFASLVLDVPISHPIRSKTVQMNAQEEVVVENDRLLARWDVSLPTRPAGGRGPRAEIPAVLFAPEEFAVEGHRGSLATWSDFARWYGSLSAGRDELPDEAVRDVEALVAGVDDSVERARRVYRYLQDRTRYVSIQLGIGGWQPFDAQYVHDRRYGDCKALTNYLQALLAVAGIEAYPALIGADRPDIDPGFPSNRFNHVVLYLPDIDESPIWLEATSTYLPFGELDEGTSDRYALVVTGDGGELQRTPPLEADANGEVRVITANLDASGALDVDVTTRYFGPGASSIRATVARLAGPTLDEWWTDEVGIARATLVERQAAQNDDRGVTLSGTLQVDRYASRSGTRLFMNPNLTRKTLVPSRSSSSGQPFELAPSAYSETDSVRLALPVGAEPEVVFEAVSIEEDFASYEASLTVEDGSLLYVRRMVVRQAVLPAEQYTAAREFLQSVSRADERPVVLRLNR